MFFHETQRLYNGDKIPSSSCQVSQCSSIWSWRGRSWAEFTHRQSPPFGWKFPSLPQSESVDDHSWQSGEMTRHRHDKYFTWKPEPTTQHPAQCQSLKSKVHGVHYLVTDSAKHNNEYKTPIHIFIITLLKFKFISWHKLEHSDTVQPSNVPTWHFNSILHCSFFQALPLQLL